MDKYSADRERDFLLGAVARSIRQPVRELTLFDCDAQLRSVGRFALPDGPGVILIPFPHRCIPTASPCEMDGERWDGLS